jgi:hypothetical protein
MKNLRITNRILEDGSAVHQVRFEAVFSDGSDCTVTLEARDRKAVARVFDALNADIAYAEADLR